MRCILLRKENTNKRFGVIRNKKDSWYRRTCLPDNVFVVTNKQIPAEEPKGYIAEMRTRDSRQQSWVGTGKRKKTETYTGMSKKR